jgi:hypothetical protein
VREVIYVSIIYWVLRLPVASVPCQATIRLTLLSVLSMQTRLSLGIGATACRSGLSHRHAVPITPPIMMQMASARWLPSKKATSCGYGLFAARVHRFQLRFQSKGALDHGTGRYLMTASSMRLSWAPGIPCKILLLILMLIDVLKPLSL